MIKQVTPDSEEHWLEMRKQNINSTEASALFGLSPYHSPFELYHIKAGTMEDTFVDNNRSEAGRFMEEAIAKYALSKLKCEGQPLKDYFYDDELRMGTSCDWEITSGPMEGWLLEVKNVDGLIYKMKWQDDEAPEHIEVQVQQQMEITGRPGTVIAHLVGGNDLKFIYRERYFEMGRGLKQAIARFWDGLASGFEPAPDYQVDSDAIIAIHQAAGHETYDAQGDILITTMLEEYTVLTDEQKLAEHNKKMKKAEILDCIGDKYLKVIASDGLSLSCGMTKSTEGKLITQDMVGKPTGGRKSFRMFRVNKKKIKEDKPETTQ